MPRPVSWLPRLHEIRRSVSSSVRSHYDRGDLEQLFELQPRAAGKLLELLPTVQVGTSQLVDREVLAGFLERVRDADDTAKLFDQVRAEKARVSRRKTRSLVRRDLDPIGIASLPSSITLTRGRMEVNFETVEELAEAMYVLARVLEAEGEEFATQYELRLGNKSSERADLDHRDLQRHVCAPERQSTLISEISGLRDSSLNRGSIFSSSWGEPG